MSDANREKRKKALMKEVLSEVDTMVPNYWADDDDSEDNLIWVIMNVILPTVIMESWITRCPETLLWTLT